MHKFISTAAIGLRMSAAALSAAPAFADQTGAGPGSIINCDASGNRQANGAIIGAIGGAIVGNNVSHGKNAPLVGAVAGAAAGSYIGCQQQRERAAARGTGTFAVRSNVNVRAAPSTSSQRINTLSAGTRVQVMAYSGNWARVRYAGGQVGYVSASYLTPTR